MQLSIRVDGNQNHIQYVLLGIQFHPQIKSSVGCRIKKQSKGWKIDISLNPWVVMSVYLKFEEAELGVHVGLPLFSITYTERTKCKSCRLWLGEGRDDMMQWTQNRSCASKFFPILEGFLCSESANGKLWVSFFCTYSLWYCVSKWVLVGFDGNCHKQHTHRCRHPLYHIILYAFLQIAGGNWKGNGNLFLFVLFDVFKFSTFLCLLDNWWGTWNFQV